MTTPQEANKAVLEEYQRKYNSHDKDLWRELFADPITYDGNEVYVDDLERVAEMWWTAFPDIRIDFTHVLADDDYVATRERFHGTHEGAYQGIEPTGNEMDLTHMVLYQLDENTIVQGWPHFDMHRFNEQLGETGAELAGQIVDYLGP